MRHGMHRTIASLPGEYPLLLPPQRSRVALSIAVLETLVPGPHLESQLIFDIIFYWRICRGMN